MIQKKNKILIIGASGKLGTALKRNFFFKKSATPTKNKLNILNQKKIKEFLSKKFQIIINCAAISSVKQCEINPSLAYKINVLGVSKLVKAIHEYEKKTKKNILFIHLSSDAVYPPRRGNNKEGSSLKPYNFYGQTKLESELLIKKLKNYIIIRTRFFDKNNIKFKDAAIDIFSSMIEINKLVKHIIFLIKINYTGIINIGGPKISDFQAISKFKKNVIKTEAKNICKKLSYKIATNASLNTSLLKRLRKKYEKTKL